MLRTNMQQNIAEILLRKYVSPLLVRTVVEKTLNVAWQVPMDDGCRLEFFERDFPFVTSMVDGVPLFCRGSYELYNGKHDDKYCWIVPNVPR